MAKKKLLFLMVVVFLVSPVVNAQAQKVADQLLAGLTTVNLRVMYSDESGMKSTGSESSQLISDTERQLSDAGLKVVSSGEFDRLVASRGYPIALLDVEVRTGKIKDTELKVYNLSIRLRQLAYVARMPTLRFLGGTWDATDFGVFDDFSFLRQRLSAVIARLVSDYRSENPK